MTKKKEGINTRMKQRARLLLYALVPVLAFVGWRLWVLIPEARSIYLQIHMAASVNSTAQVFYDKGEGLSEEASTRLSVGVTDRFLEYRFWLPRETIHYLRYDPLMSPGTVFVQDMAVVDGLGRTIISIDLRWVQPGQQIQSLEIVRGVLIAVMEKEGEDPQLAIALPEPLRPERVSVFTILHIGARVFIESTTLFVIVVILLIGANGFLGSGLAMNLRGRVPAALILTLLVIGFIEAVQHTRLPAKASYHEVDDLLYRLGRDRFDADGVILGNSVAYQVFNHPPFLERTNVAMLATNEAIGMTGQYFIMQRYLERNRPPRAVILMTLPSLEGSLSYETTDNYLCRTFTRAREILDVFLLKRDPVFALKAAAYRLFPAFKYRLQLQKAVLGITNAPIYTGAAHTGRSAQNKNYSVTEILQDELTCKDIPRRHFVKLLDLLKIHGIPLHFLTPPLKEGNLGSQLHYGQAFEHHFPELRKDHSLLHWSNRTILYPDRLFNDEVHFSKEGLPLARLYLYGLADEIMRTGGGAKTHDAL